jgi:hypothetical protein
VTWQPLFTVDDSPGAGSADGRSDAFSDDYLLHWYEHNKFHAVRRRAVCDTVLLPETSLLTSLCARQAGILTGIGAQALWGGRYEASIVMSSDAELQKLAADFKDAMKQRRTARRQLERERRAASVGRATRVGAAREDDDGDDDATAANSDEDRVADGDAVAPKSLRKTRLDPQRYVLTGGHRAADGVMHSCALC